jgi:hypothetical protein
VGMNESKKLLEAKTRDELACVLLLLLLLLPQLLLPLVTRLDYYWFKNFLILCLNVFEKVLYTRGVVILASQEELNWDYLFLKVYLKNMAIQYGLKIIPEIQEATQHMK